MPFDVFGAIGEKWHALNGEQGVLGPAVSDEIPTFDGVGRFRNFAGGIISWHPQTGANAVWGGIAARWLELGREAFGYPITDESRTPDGRGRYNHFRALQHPGNPETSIYWTPQTGAHPVWGAIRQRWAEMGWEKSFLGYPRSMEMDFPEGGRVSAFEGGAIYWWPDIGAHEVGEMFVHYQGLNCFATSGGAGSDEPYVAMGLSIPGEAARSLRSQIYQEVDGGDTRPDQVLLYRGQPRGIQIVSQLLEHDAGEPAHYQDIMKGVASAASAGVGALITLIPGLGPVLAAGAAPVLAALTPAIAQALKNLVGLGDDLLGPPVKTVLSAKDMILMAERPNVTERNVTFKIASPLIVSGDGANYKIYFGGSKVP